MRLTDRINVLYAHKQRDNHIITSCLIFPVTQSVIISDFLKSIRRSSTVARNRLYKYGWKFVMVDLRTLSWLCKYTVLAAVARKVQGVWDLWGIGNICERRKKARVTRWRRWNSKSYNSTLSSLIIKTPLTWYTLL